MNAYRRDFDENKYMFFLIKDKELLEKYNENWGKVSKFTKKGFDSEPAYKEKYLKTKIRSYEEKVSTNFDNAKMPKESSHCIHLSMVLIGSIFELGKNYSPRVFLKDLSKKNN